MARNLYVKNWLFNALASMCVGCTDKPPYNRIAQKAIDSLGCLSDSVQNLKQVAYWRRVDSIKLYGIGEPNISFYKKEVFRLIYSFPYSNRLLFRVEKLSDSTYELTSTYCFYNGGEPNRPVPIKPKRLVIGQYIEGYDDTLLYFTQRQLVSKKDWYVFKRILEGSYYWAYVNPLPNVEFNDPKSLSMESVSIIPYSKNEDSLVYHYNYLPVLIKSPFTEAFNFLLDRSVIAQKLNTDAKAMHIPAN